MWVTRRAVVAVFGGETVGIGVHIQHAGEQRALCRQPVHHPGILFGGGVIAKQAGTGQGGFPGDIEQIFHRIRNGRQAG
ncbi:hypothetical protein D3C80_2001040 [compost metagenome]